MKTLNDIFGQEAAIEWLRRAYESDRLPHGLIFAGPVGVGKATTAAALATLFLCRNPHGTQACGECDSCGVFDSGNHPDYHVITRDLIRFHDKTGKSKGIDLSIHVIRPELVDPAGRKTVLGRGKVFVIEQAELMNAQAQNAMLKTLEEPAGRTLIILLTDQPEILLPTIRSRCQLVRFSPLPAERVRQELKKRNIDEPTASAAADLSNGSLGIALKWIEDGVVSAAGDLIRQLDALIAGQPAEGLGEWIRKAADAYAVLQLKRDELGSKDQATREGLSIYLRIAAEHFQKRMETRADDADQIEHFASAIDVIARAQRYLDANVNIPLVFQQLSLALSEGGGLRTED
jgi:DNA polymerase III subunit delta'